MKRQDALQLSVGLIGALSALRLLHVYLGWPLAGFAVAICVVFCAVAIRTAKGERWAMFCRFAAYATCTLFFVFAAITFLGPVAVFGTSLRNYPVLQLLAPCASAAIYVYFASIVVRKPRLVPSVVACVAGVATFLLVGWWG